MILVCFRCRQPFATSSDLFAHRMTVPSRCTLAWRRRIRKVEVSTNERR